MVTRSEYVIAAVGLLLGLTACTPATTATPSATITPTPSVTSPSVTPSPTPTWSTDQQAAVKQVETYYRAFNEVMRQERHPNDLATVARNDALAEAQRTFNEFGMAGLTVKGEVVASDLVPGALRTTNDRPTVRVKLCDDSRGWSVVDDSGKDILAGSAKVIRPLVSTVQSWDGDWYVTRLAKGDHTC